MFKTQGLRFVAGALLVGVVFTWSNTLWIYGKAHLAQHLIKHSWEKTLDTGQDVYPWPWADSKPIAHLNFPKQQKALYVLSGSHGTSLAFGPGHVDGTALPNSSGTQIYSGHRDTHFEFFKNLKTGDIFQIESKDGRQKRYLIDRFVIADITKGDWWINPAIDEVHLITCYPLTGAHPNPQKRIIAIAEPVFDKLEHFKSSL